MTIVKTKNKIVKRKRDYDSMKMPIFRQLMSDDRKAQNAIEVINAFDLQVVTMGVYPHFTLIPNEVYK